MAVSAQHPGGGDQKFKTSQGYSVSLKSCKLEKGREGAVAAAIQLLGKPQKKV